MNKDKIKFAIGVSLAVSFIISGWALFSGFGLVWGGIICYCLLIGRGATHVARTMAMYAAILLLPAVFISSLAAVFTMGFVGPLVVGIYTYWSTPSVVAK